MLLLILIHLKLESVNLLQLHIISAAPVSAVEQHIRVFVFFLLCAEVVDFLGRNPYTSDEATHTYVTS